MSAPCAEEFPNERGAPSRAIICAASCADDDSSEHLSALETLVEEAFAGGGPLARADANYVQRESQRVLALGVAQAIEARVPLVAEAGTGIGKTFAYLVPALLSGARTLVSTATKNLQDQLYARDLPRLRQALGVPTTVALLKGRSSYLCVYRMRQARQGAQLPDRWAVRTLASVEQWAAGTATGDLAEMPGLDERSPVIPLVTSTRENCLGSECPDFKTCHFVRARREAMAADLVVVNHHLFFADMNLREGGIAELLPSVEVAIFDEAHQLGEAGVQFLGQHLGSVQLVDFARDVLGTGLQNARGLADWASIAARCDRAGRDLRLAAAGALREVRAMIKLRWEERSQSDDFLAALADVRRAVGEAHDALETMSELGPEFVRLGERARELGERADAFMQPCATGHVRWIDVSAHQARLAESPLDIREALREEMAPGGKAWIFTSATLGDDDRLSWFTESAGLEGERVIRAQSPFDYARHARVYVPQRFPKPNEAGHAESVGRLAARCAAALGGRTFVLTTTLRALPTVSQALRDELAARAPGMQVMVQGTASKRQLLQEYLAAPNAVLVGSHSFWEGIDVPGDALQCVVIDKLPFPPPNDPLVEARVKRLEAQRRNAFSDYFVAEAAVSLKQGAGRLIRSETDRGLLVICDPRTATMGYGRRLIAALPPMTRLHNEDEAIEWLRSLRA